MSEYIEREAACSSMPDDYYGWRDKQLLKSIPSADVSPVRHGRWLKTDDFSDEQIDWVSCGICKAKIPDFDYPYCPNCGAKMDGGDTSERQTMAFQSQND